MDALTGVYSILPSVNVNQCTFLVSELLSDDRLGGGAAVDRSWAAMDQLKKINDDMFPDFWKKMYQGIFRSNMLLETLDVVKTWEKPELKDQIAAEARFLRAYFYFELCRMFGTVPLVLTTEAVNNPRAEARELYAQMADDLKYAIQTLPDKKYEVKDSQLGHATKWAAESLMARVYLWIGDKANAALKAKEVIDGCGFTLAMDNTKDVSLYEETIFGLGRDDMETKVKNDWAELTRYANELYISNDNCDQVFNKQNIGINDIRYKTDTDSYMEKTEECAASIWDAKWNIKRRFL